MRITIIGTGYVGLVTGTCFAEMGNRVICVDTDSKKIEALLRGEIPIYEPGLDEMVKRNLETGDLQFTTSLQEALPNAQFAFIAVGTPMGEDGSADLNYVMAVAGEIGQFMTGDLIVVNKSTVPVGTADLVRDTIRNALQRRVDAGDVEAKNYRFHVVSNPEFLKEGAAIADFMKPDRIVIGADSSHVKEMMQQLYQPFVVKGNRVFAMDVRSAEVTKYAANAMLASRISFMNEISRLCDAVGANVSNVRQGIGADTRIGNSFLFAGCGYGGSCFPKDIKALIKTMLQHGVTPTLLQAIEQVNNEQKQVVWQTVVRHFGEDLSGKIFAVWGLTFKPNTDDMREAPSLTTIEELLRRGATVQVFDPKALEQARNVYFKDISGIEYCSNKYDALNEADSLLLLTEWAAFRSPDFDEIKRRLRTPVIVDGRNQFERFALTEQGFDYYAIGVSGFNDKSKT